MAILCPNYYLFAFLISMTLAPSSGVPNIVWIMSDDLGYGELSSFGQTNFNTPNIDRLAREGVRFTSAYCGEAVCAPSRGALMTGLHMGHAYIRGNGKKGPGGTDTPLRENDTTVAQLLQQAGYYTGMVGKWGLGVNGTVGSAERKGFDYFFGEPDQSNAHNMYPEYLFETDESRPGGLREVSLTGNTRQKVDGAPAFSSSVVHLDSGLCLGVEGGDFGTVGSPLLVYNCNSKSSQSWRLDAETGLLLNGNSTAAGRQLCASSTLDNSRSIVLDNCDTMNKFQRWILNSNQQLAAMGSESLCMTAKLSLQQAESAFIFLAQCAVGAPAADSQTFHFLNPIPSRERCMSAPDDFGNFGGCNYTHDLFTEHALDFLEQRSLIADQPFFLYVAWTDPHAGGWGSNVEEGNPVPFDGEYLNEFEWPVTERDHASVIQNVQDRDVGRIITTLQETGLDKNTIVFFASDNGASDEGGHSASFFNSSGPLRGVKRSLYEGGIRSPSSVRWPGYIAPGKVSDFAWSFSDFLPTALDLAGRRDLIPEGVDGISILPTLVGEEQDRGDICLYWEFCTNDMWGRAARKGRWKAVALSSELPTELYDIMVDLGETTNLAELFPDVVKDMEDCMDAEHEDSVDWPVGDGICVTS